MVVPMGRANLTTLDLTLFLSSKHLEVIGRAARLEDDAMTVGMTSMMMLFMNLYGLLRVIKKNTMWASIFSVWYSIKLNFPKGPKVYNSIILLKALGRPSRNLITSVQVSVFTFKVIQNLPTYIMLLIIFSGNMFLNRSMTIKLTGKLIVWLSWL